MLETPSWNSGAYFTTGRYSSPCAISTLANLITPSLPMKISKIRSLVPLWKVFVSLSFPDHVGILLRRFDRCSQIIVASAFFPPNRKWLAVSSVRSSVPSFNAARWVALKICSTRHIVVLNTSSVTPGLFKIAIMTFLQLCNSLVQIPTKCRAPGGLNFQTIFFWAKSLSIFALSHSFLTAFCSLAAPTKLVPMSLMTVFGWLRLAMKLVTAVRHDLMSDDCTAWMFIG